MKKDDIVDALDAYLQRNQTRLARNATFEPYYGARRTPYKTAGRPSGGSGVTSDEGEMKSVVRGRGRRATKVKQEVECVFFPSRLTSPRRSTRTNDLP